MEGQGAELDRLNVEVLERLGVGVDHLVDELTLHLVGGDGGPPEELVQVVRQRLEDGLGHVDVTAVLDDFAVDQLGNLGGGVVLGAVQLEGLTDGAVVVQHALQSSTDINGLSMLASILTKSTS